MTISNKEKSKRYYKSLIKDHQQMLAKMRCMINHLLDNIIEDMNIVGENIAPNSPENAPKTTLNNRGVESYPIESAADNISEKNAGEISETDNKDISTDYSLQATDHKKLPLYTGKESLADVIARVGRIAIKIIPLEQQLARMDLTKLELEELHEVAEHLHQHDHEEDMEVIEDYIQRYNKQHGYVKLEELEGKGWTKPKDPHDIPMPYVLVEE